MNAINPINQVRMFLSMFSVQLPTLLVCVVAIVMVIVKWRLSSRASLWALLGFGLGLIICILIPMSLAIIQTWALQTANKAQRGVLFRGFSIFWSVLQGATYALLLVAVLIERPASGAAAPPFKQV